jgi:hypothetical protein
VAELRGEVRREFKDVKQRLSSMEVSLIDLRRDDLHTDSNVARQQVTIDELLDRIQRIEKRRDMS